MHDIIHKDAADLRIRTLWREVIMQAVRDACGAYTGGSETSERVRNEARAWLLRNSRDFRDVCEYAQISPDVVISAAKTMADGGWVVPKGYFNLNFHYFDGGQLKKKRGEQSRPQV